MSANQTPPASSVGAGQPSSPFTGTEHTLYTPEAVRKGESSKAAGKKPAVKVPSIRHTAYDGLEPRPHALPVFVNEIDPASGDFISRYVLVQKVPDGGRYVDAGSDHETELARVQAQMTNIKFFDTCVPIYSRGIYLRFDNLQDAIAGKQIMERNRFVCAYVDNYAFAIAKSQDTAAIDEFEGQLRIDVRADPAVGGLQVDFTLNDLRLMHDDLEAALSRFGKVRDFVNVSVDDLDLRFVFRFEFYSVGVANRARASLRDQQMTRQCDNGLWVWTISTADNWVGSRPPNSPHRHLPRVDDKGRMVDYRFPHMQPAPSVSLMSMGKGDEKNQNHNQVVRSRIESGLDVRTTIMLRNIPNKLDWLTLKALLDRVCFGTYDFVYLRIDFKSGHNVGYAFINFCDIKGMLAMLEQVEHRGWPGYRSSKNAELSYATIQGREALVQKFRNSSVMQQIPYCRPRLFVTKEEAWILQNIRKTGCEVEFPEPDNWSKFQRSIDSARTVGLFPPTGTVHQPADRAHTSAYDRGTPRDTLHMYAQYGNPPNFNTYTESQKRVAEKMYAEQFGTAESGIVVFEHIPTCIVKGYLGHPVASAAPSNPGPIARPPAGMPNFNMSNTIPLYGFGAANMTATDPATDYAYFNGHQYRELE